MGGHYRGDMTTVGVCAWATPVTVMSAIVEYCTETGADLQPVAIIMGTWHAPCKSQGNHGFGASFASLARNPPSSRWTASVADCRALSAQEFPGVGHGKRTPAIGSHEPDAMGRRVSLVAGHLLRA